MFDEPSFCIVSFGQNNLELVKGWNGFVTPEGTFLKVTEMDTFSTGHDEFVKLYCDMVLHIDLAKAYREIQEAKPEYKNKNLSYKDMFIEVLGYVNFEKRAKGLEIRIPDPKINGHIVNSKQIRLLDKLTNLNELGTSAMNAIFVYDRKENKTEVHMRK